MHIVILKAVQLMLGPTLTLEKLQQKNTEVSGVGEVHTSYAGISSDGLSHSLVREGLSVEPFVDGNSTLLSFVVSLNWTSDWAGLVIW